MKLLILMWKLQKAKSLCCEGAWVLWFNVNQTGSPCTNKASNKTQAGTLHLVRETDLATQGKQHRRSSWPSPSPPTLSFTFHPFQQPTQRSFVLIPGTMLSALDPDLSSSRLDPWRGPGRMDTVPLALLFLAVSGSTSQYLHWKRPSLSGK